MIRPSRSMLAATVLAATVLTACGASAPPAEELAIEIVDSMVEREEITERQAECMREEVAAYEGELLDDIGERAANGDEGGIADLAEFQASLAECRASN